MERPWYKHYDPNVPKTVNYPEVPVWKLLEQTAKEFPQKTALDFMGHTLSYTALWESSLRFAGALKQQGLQTGDRVAIMLPNTPQFVIAFYGTLLAGGIAVNINPLYTPRELLGQLKDAGAQTLVILDLLWPRFAEIDNESGVKNVITTGIQDFLPFPKNLLFPLKARREGRWVNLPKHPRRHSFKTLLQAPPLGTPHLAHPDDVALLQYTGGTTGTSKGAMLSHRNLIANTFQCIAWDAKSSQNRGKGVMLGAIPFFHVYGMSSAMNFAIASGFKNVILPRPEVGPAIEAIEKHGVTHFPGVPTLYLGFNSFPGIEKRKVGSIQVCISGSAPLPIEVMETFERLTGGKLVEGYGLTESAPSTHCNPLYGERRKGSIGLPIPGVDCKILDEEHREVAIGEVGELAIKGPNIMKGYWNRPDESAKTLVDGWLLTGDMARMDADGYFYIVDRKKDMINASGYKIYPREVEEVLYTHPAIQEAAVTGIADAYRGETVAAFIVLRIGHTLSTEEVEKYCRERLAAYKVPKHIEFRTELPKTAVGKILRRSLRQESPTTKPANKV